MKLYLATGNAHKLTELTAILAAARINAEVLPPSVVGGMPHVHEDTGSFEGNARKKALALAVKIREDAIGQSRSHQSEVNSSSVGPPSDLTGSDWLAVADDSGLCVDALHGAPGVESAYFAGTPSNDAANNAKLLTLLRDIPSEKRTAAFHCCIVAATPDGRTYAFAGRCPGRVLTAPRGNAGFGYDPLFLPDGESRTAAELPPEIKNRISHRARALAEFVAWLRSPA